MSEPAAVGDHAILVTADRQYWIFVELTEHACVPMRCDCPFCSRAILRCWFLCGASRVKFLKKTYSVKPLLGAPYGSVFEVQKTQLVRVEGKMSSEMELAALMPSSSGDAASAPAVEDTVDGAQVLDGDDIAAMRAQGASGHEIISALVENSATWSGKTEFAKEKYLKKKAIKCVFLPILEDTILFLGAFVNSRLDGVRFRLCWTCFRDGSGTCSACGC